MSSRLVFKMTQASENDYISVELEPEKKGLLLKHREYTVTSSECYKPANSEFIEARRRALKRFLNLIARHPAMKDDMIFTSFLTFKGSDTGSKLKEQYKGTPDEFLTSSIASRAKDFVPTDTQGNLSNSRQQIHTIHRCVEKMRDVADRLADRSAGSAIDMMAFSRSLHTLADESSPVTEWATGGCRTWSNLQHGCKSLIAPFADLAEKLSLHGCREIEEAEDILEMFLELTGGYKELLERHEKGVLRDHQIALHKMQQYKQKHMSAAVRGTEHVDQLEHRIIQQEDAIHTIENRNYFSLYCLQMETQLIHSNLIMLVDMLRSLVEIEVRKHSELARLWQEMRTPVDNLITACTTPSPRQSPTSPTAPPLF